MCHVLKHTVEERKIAVLVEKAICTIAPGPENYSPFYVDVQVLL